MCLSGKVLNLILFQHSISCTADKTVIGEKEGGRIPEKMNKGNGSYPLKDSLTRKRKKLNRYFQMTVLFNKKQLPVGKESSTIALNARSL